MADERDSGETGETGDTGDRQADPSGVLAVGDLAPDFRLPASDGREIALSAYRGRAHVVLFFVRAFG